MIEFSKKLVYIGLYHPFHKRQGIMTRQTPPPKRKSEHIIGVVGVRDHRGSLYENSSYVIRTLEQHIAKQGLPLSSIAVVTGGGKGVEGIVCDWCEAKNVPVRKIPPNIVDHGPRKAFVIRNNHVVSQSDELVMFWDGSINLLGESIMTAMHMSKQATVFPVI